MMKAEPEKIKTTGAQSQEPEEISFLAILCPGQLLWAGKESSLEKIAKDG